ncbi:hypothetical protein AAVH_08091 [Aphelenchoides avenae]|nr:hypothetical protein AAVH_08091 [Aphelenchus avenae]
MTRHNFGHYMKVITVFIAIATVILSVVSVAALFWTSHRDGLAVMLLPCVILLILLCLLSRRIDSVLRRQQQQHQRYVETHLPANVITPNNYQPGRIITEKEASYAKDLAAQAATSQQSGVVSEALMPQTPPPRYDETAAATHVPPQYVFPEAPQTQQSNPENIP